MSETPWRPIPPHQLERLLSDLEQYRPPGRAIAAFDADGTLWDTDLGEAFFAYQIKNKLVPLPPDPWGRYNWLKVHKSHPEAYLWLAQILRGVPLWRVRQWAELSVAERPLPVFAEQKQVLEKLHQLEVEVYIVTASIKWAVEPGARRLGLLDSQVLGIETEITSDGLVSEKQKGLITYREGKAQALLEQTKGVSPYFCAGNTEGDKWLLEAASHVRLVMSAAPENSENFATEAKMMALAKSRDWYFHRYR